MKNKLAVLFTIMMVLSFSPLFATDTQPVEEVQINNGSDQETPLTSAISPAEDLTKAEEPAEIEYKKVKETGNINKIIINGNERTEDDTILSYIDIKKGGTFNQQKSDESLRSLYATGLFSSVDINYKSGTVTINVTENPIINKIVFEGNDALKSDLLQAELSLKPKMIFSKAKVQADTSRLVQIYNKTGRFAAVVNPQIIELPQNRINLVYEIKEGKKAKIGKIIFIGNKHFSSNELSSVIMSKESKFYNFFARTDYYDPDLVENDKFLLTRYYNSQGYAAFKVVSATAELVQAKNEFYLTFSVEEGDQYDFGAIDLKSSIPQVDIESLRKAILTTQGETYNLLLVEKTNEAMLKILANQGYPFVNIDPVYDINIEQKTIGIRYEIGAARKVYIGRINIKGNLKTHDSVIRREFRLSEGDPYNEFLLDRSEQRLTNLDFFEKVTVKPQKTNKDDIVDVDVDVQEKSTASLKFSVGYSTTDGIFGLIGLTERNFVGKGQQVSATIQKSATTYGLTLGFVEPYFMEQNLSAGVEVFTTSTRGRKRNIGSSTSPNSYDSASRGVSFNFGYDMLEYLYHNFGYTAEQNTISKVASNAPYYIKQQSGRQIASILRQGFTYDRTDNNIVPKRGYILKLSQNLAGLGGDSRYISNDISAAYYYPIIKDKVTLKLAGITGMINDLGKTLKITENYNLGDATFRGFEAAGVGPRDKATLDSLGGAKYYKGTTELSFPLGLPEEFDVSGSVFSDFGSLWNLDLAKNSEYTKANYYDSKSLRTSVGFGVLWVTKMGPLRLDIAKAVKRQKYDETQNVHISFQTNF